MRPTVVAAAVLLFALLCAPFAWGKPDLVVVPGQLFPVHVDGFAARTPVELRMAYSNHKIAVRANAQGVLNTTYRAPMSVGRYRLLVSGLPKIGRADRATAAVIVPRIAIIPIKVQPPGGEGTSGSGHHRGPPASTGTDLLPLLEIAAALLAAGGALLTASQRRRG